MEGFVPVALAVPVEFSGRPCCGRVEEDVGLGVVEGLAGKSMVSVRGRRRSPRSVRRGQLIDAARAITAQHSAAALTVRGVAEAAGICLNRTSRLSGECALPVRGVAELQDPHATGERDDDRAGDRGEQQRHAQRQGEVPPEQLQGDAVEVLQDEHQ
ncbi:hypothetical protein SAMN04490239_1228 [Rhodococcus koreensis]|uniref:Uncharacterized protein n=1 Tax=Rhodococcus koreensis TaxID=99653 RepID=A0A1H4LDP5_9NOCA|nr:hypothetical protein SAMN04490239_1228 [Rhodococcus koreensis]